MTFVCLCVCLKDFSVIISLLMNTVWLQITMTALVGEKGPIVAMVTVVSKRLPGDSEKHPVFKIKVTHQVHIICLAYNIISR